jgi:hypothetical protein
MADGLRGAGDLTPSERSDVIIVIDVLGLIVMF